MLNKLKTKIENKMLQGFLSILLKRIKSKSPKFYIALRYLSGFAIVIFVAAIAVLKKNTFGIDATLVSHIVSGLTYAGTVIAGVWGTSFTGTVNTDLFAPEEKPDSK